MTEKVVVLNQEKSSFDTNLQYLLRSGLYNILWERAKEHEGLNDETIWQCRGLGFEGLPNVDLHIIKSQKRESGREAKHIHFKYDGEVLKISGIAENLALKVTLDSAITKDIREKIGVALEKSFKSPQITFLTLEDLLSSD